MKKLINSIRSKVNSLATSAVVAVSNIKAEGYVDSGVKILIAVVIGALLLGGLYALFGEVIMPTVTERIEGLFDFAGKSQRPGAFSNAPGLPLTSLQNGG